MNRGTKLLVLMAVLAVVIGGCFAAKSITAKKEAESASETESAESLAVGEYESISALQWEYLGETVTLEKNDDGQWICLEDETLPVDQDKADTLVTAAAEVAGQLYVPAAEDLTEYGLDDPELTVTVTAGETQRSYAVGDYNSLAAMYYMSLDGGSDVYLEDGSLENSFWYDLENLVKFESAPTDALSYESVLLQSDVQSYQLQRLEEPLTVNYTDAFEWFEVQNDAYRALDTSGAENICSLITGLNFASCVTWNASAAELAEYGLTDPQCTVQLNYTDSEGESQSFALAFGSYADGGEVYVRLEDSKMVYLTDGETLDELMYSDLVSLLPEDFLSTSGAVITSVQAKIEGESYTLDPADEDVAAFIEQLGTVYSTGSAAGKEGREEIFSLELGFDSEVVDSLSVSFYAYDSTSTLCQAGEEQAFVSRSSADGLKDDLIALISGDSETAESETESTETNE